MSDLFTYRVRINQATYALIRSANKIRPADIDCFVPVTFRFVCPCDDTALIMTFTGVMEMSIQHSLIWNAIHTFKKARRVRYLEFYA